MRSLLLAAAVAMLGFGCAMPSWVPWFGRDSAPAVAPDERYGVAVVDDAAVVEFYERASYFYGRLELRRVNTLSTYRDEVLRDFFRTEAAFSDYYADLAQNLVEANFERNRALELEVVEFRVEGPGLAEVVTRIEGDNGLPLRWWGTALERVDRWERLQGRWWIVPSKL